MQAPTNKNQHYMNQIIRDRRERISVVIVLLFAITMSSCTSSEEQAREARLEQGMARLAEMRVFADSVAQVDSVNDAIVAEAEGEFPDITYRSVHVADRSTLDSIRDAFDYGESKSHRYKSFVTLNRRVFGSVRVGDTVVLPDPVAEDMRAYSVLPHVYFGAEDIPKLIVITNAFQSYGCYENGRLVRFAATNTGTEQKPTLPGRYAVNWKERLRTSSINENWKLPFNLNFHLFAGNAFHQYYMPGRPASHSCVRQFMDDAEWLFNWAEVGRRNENGRVIRFTGTPVLILDMFDYSRKRFGPWLDLASNRDEKLEVPPSPMEVEEAWIPISQIPPSVRGALPDRKRYEVAEDTLRARGVLREEARLAWSIEYPTKKEKAERNARSAAAAARASKPATTPDPAPSTPAPAPAPSTPAPTPPSGE